MTAAGRHAAVAVDNPPHGSYDNGDNGRMQVWQHAALSSASGAGSGSSDALRAKLVDVAGKLIQHAQQLAVAEDADAVHTIDDRRRQKRKKQKHNLLLLEPQTGACTTAAGPIQELKLVPVGACGPAPSSLQLIDATPDLCTTLLFLPSSSP
jgi:hypothetical protein